MTHDLDAQNAETIARVHNRRLEPLPDAPECEECGDSGFTIGTDTEQTYGSRCSQGCRVDMRILKGRA